MILHLYNGLEQSRHIDEAVDRVMEKNGWAQSYQPEFTRLGLGFAGAAVAGYVFYLERTVPFRESRWFVGALCALYFAFIWGAALWKRFVEHNAVYIGSKNGTTVYIATKNPKNTNQYEVTVHLEAQGVKEQRKHTFLIPEIVDTLGVVHEEKLVKLIDLVSLDIKKTQ